jgi:hypothetical protein
VPVGGVAIRVLLQAKIGKATGSGFATAEAAFASDKNSDAI